MGFAKPRECQLVYTTRELERLGVAGRDYGSVRDNAQKKKKELCSVLPMLAGSVG